MFSCHSFEKFPFLFVPIEITFVRKFLLHYLFDIIVFDTLGAAFWFGNPFLTTAFPIQLTCMVELRVCKDIIPAFDLLKVVSHLMLV